MITNIRDGRAKSHTVGYAKIYGGILKLFAFPKKRRLVKNSQFKAVLARNLRVSDDLLTLYIAENDCGHPRLGVSVGKSCGSAVVRNRLKRLLREVFRQSQDSIPAGFDYLLMFAPKLLKNLDKSDSKEVVKKLTFEQVKTSFLALVDAAIEKNQVK